MASTSGKQLLIDGTSCVSSSGEITNFLTLSFHDVIPIDTLQSTFYFEESKHHPGVTVTSLICGSIVATLQMLSDMMWALRREHFLSRSDIVHLIMTIDNDPKNQAFIDNIGFRQVGVCFEEHFDNNLQENVSKGQVRLESTAGQLLDQMEDRGLSIPFPSSNLWLLKRNYEYLANQVDCEDLAEQFNCDDPQGQV